VERLAADKKPVKGVIGDAVAVRFMLTGCSVWGVPEDGPDVAADKVPELIALEKKGWIWHGCEFVLDWLAIIGPDDVSDIRERFVF
jgi:hypothetical protein